MIKRRNSILDKLGAQRQTLKPEESVGKIVEPYRELGRELYKEEAFTRPVEEKPKTSILDKLKTTESYADRRDTRLYEQDIARKQEKETRDTSKERSQMLERQLSDKYGIDIKRVNSPIELTNITANLPSDRREQFKKDFAEYTKEIERSNPFRAGAESGFNVLPTMLERTEGKEEVKSATGFGAGRFVGGVGQQAAFASVLGPSLESAFGKLGATPLVTETLKDVAIGTGTQLLEQPFDKTTPTQMLGNAALDIAINVVLGKLGKAFANASELKSAKTPDVVEQVARELNVTNEQADQIIDKAINEVRTRQTAVEPMLSPRVEEPRPNVFNQHRVETKLTEGSVIKSDITATPFDEAEEELFETQLKTSKEMLEKNLKQLEGETYRITSNQTKNSVIISKRGNQIQATVMDKDYKPMMDRRFDTYDEFIKNFSQDPLIDGELKVSFTDPKIEAPSTKQIVKTEPKEIKTEVWYEGSKLYDPQTFKVVPNFYKDGEYIAHNYYGKHTDAAKDFEKSDVYKKIVENLKAQKQATLAPSQIDLTPKTVAQTVETPKAEIKSEIPISERRNVDLADRKLKAFQFENPEVQPFYREKAEELLDDATFAKKGSRTGTLARDEAGEVVNRYGDPSAKSPILQRIFDETGVTKYEDVKKALNDLILDKGKENNALAKRIEPIVDDMLVKGYRRADGLDVPPNEAYINLRNQIDNKTVSTTEIVRDGFDDFLDAMEPPKRPVAQNIEQPKPKSIIEKLQEPTMAEEPLLNKFRLDLFGAKPDSPVPANLNGNTVNVIGLVDEGGIRYANLDNGTRVNLDELKPIKFVEQVGEGATRERGYSQNVRTDANRPEELRQAMDKDKLFYQQLENKTTLEKAQLIFGRGYEQALKDFRRTSQELRAENVPLSKLIADEAITRGDQEVAVEVISTMAETLTKAGQFSQAARILRESNSPATILDFVQKELKRLNEQGLKRYGQERKILGKDAGWKKIELTDDEFNMVAQMSADATNEQKELMFEELFNSISKRIPTTKREKLDSFRRMAMLFNPKTHVRNILGNAIMSGVKAVSDKVAAGIERVALPQDQLTKSIKSASKKSKQIANDYFEANKKTILDGDRWEIFGVKSPFAEKQIFKSGWLETLNEWSKKSLEFEDVVFLKHHFTNDLAKFMDARGLTEPTEEAVKYALRRAQEATFREANELAQAINKLKGTKFGLIVEAAIPFTKTPANIMKTGVQYSPIGAIQGALQMIFKSDPPLAIETLSKGLTGTGLSLLGFYLAKNGMMRGEYEKGKPEDLSQATGVLPNSIITPGGSYTIDWAQPAAIPLFMGVAVAEELAKSKDAEFLDVAFKSLAAGGDTLINQSMLRNVKDLFGGYGSTAEKFLQLPLDYVSQTFPTAFGQIARSQDPVKRQTDYSTIGSGLLTSMQAKTPTIPVLGSALGLPSSQTLPAKYDLLGKEQTYGEKGLLNTFIQLLSPGYVGTKTDDPTLNEINRLYKSVGQDAIPRTNVSSFQQDGEKITLNNVEKSEWQRIMGDYTRRELERLFNTFDYKTMSDVEKAKAISKINEKGYELAKKTFLSNRK